MIPQLNAIGTYKANAPFTIREGSVYKCQGISTFPALESLGIDVFNTYYEPYDLNRTQYAADSDNKVSIVTLISTTGDPTLYIPSSYITAVPSVNMVPYNRMIISVDLGLIPDELSLAEVSEQIKEYASDLIGVPAKVKLHRVAVTGGIDEATHATLEATRLAARKYRATPHTDVKRLAGVLEKRDERLELLEEALIGMQL